MNNYYTSTGEKVSQDTINNRRKEGYRHYPFGVGICAGCGKQAQAFAHTVAQARCKMLHKADWIWAGWNFWPACHDCNSAWESFKGEDCRQLLNYQELLQVLKEHDYAQWLKYTHL